MPQALPDAAAPLLPEPRLRYDRGTLVWEAPPDLPTPPGFVDDDRIHRPRAPGLAYREAVEWCLANRIPFRDDARTWQPLPDLEHLVPREPRPYQREAVAAWKNGGRRGVVVLPTGAGKTYVAEMAVLETRRPTLVVAPTVNLVAQWHRRLRLVFDRPVGVLGGGSHEVEDLTVSTYASAWRHADRLGDRFGLVIFDEVHHLPADVHQGIAECLLAPFRLGLTATPERADDAHLLLDHLVGPEVYRKEIGDLSGEFLAPYETVRLDVALVGPERAAYQAARDRYRAFVKAQGIRFGSPQDWTRFIQVASRSKAGRDALKGWFEARRIAHGTARKLEVLEQILAEEAGRRTLVFTDDNATAWRVSRAFLVPCITHHTTAKERVAILEGLSAGTYTVVVTTRVLNEGVDIPEAEVAVVLAGSGSVREHVQRLGRILRPHGGKQAILYEMVTAGTSEERTSERRREHEAYQC